MPFDPSSPLDTHDLFVHRHLGPSDNDVTEMLASVGCDSLGQLMDQAIPDSIRMKGKLDMHGPSDERSVLESLESVMSANKTFRSYIGMGYYGCLTPAVIQRNILEDPGWYTQYTPYQPEISQGRLEALLNFQTMVSDLTGMEVSTASLLDEGTAAAEAMTLCRRIKDRDKNVNTFFVASHCHPQTIDVVRTRAEPLGFDIEVGDFETHEIKEGTFGVLVQYPTTQGDIPDLEDFCRRAHEKGALVVVASDLLALTLLRPPGEFGADIVVGNSQRFGVPMGFGGPHAAFIATQDAHKRKLPGRIVGVSRDAEGNDALRLALQTREQHIRRDRATSNICTAQVLLAIMASMYAVYHGPEGLKRIAQRVHAQTKALAHRLKKLGHKIANEDFFDTFKFTPKQGQEATLKTLRDHGINLRIFEDGDLGIALDETTTPQHLGELCKALGGDSNESQFTESRDELANAIPSSQVREGDILPQPVFHRYHTETELLRYMTRLRNKDLSLTTSMIPLGSCTMKLNATTEMIPITWPNVASLHPFTPSDQTRGYDEMLRVLEGWLAEITGFAATSLQPNAGSQGEYAGLLAIRGYHRSRGDLDRDVCIIPASAHGTNPASAVLAGMKVVVVKCDEDGNIDVADLRAKAEKHTSSLGALMVTYPSTHGVFEASIREVCDIIHQHGGQVYLDGANLNAMVGLCRPGDFGADVCHLNLHKTFCIPHGGGGPGMGPICVAEHLAPFLPSHTVVPMGGDGGVGAVSAAPWGSASILPISYLYIHMMGAEGLTRATEIAILNANYIAKRLEPHFPVLYRGQNDLVAHECIVDVRPLGKTAGIDVDDVAKRLMDYGFHAPTMSFPVAGTLMIEPTESESKEELDRFCDAMIAIRQEIREIEEGKADREQNLLKGAPHTASRLTADSWDRPYSRERAAFPAPWTRESKFWPAVSRIDHVHGDRCLICTWSPEDVVDD